MKPRYYSAFLRLRAVLFVLGLFTLSQAASADPNKGPGMVRREFPEFYQAARENLGVHEANEFFERWTLAEISILHNSLAFIEERATLLRDNSGLFDGYIRNVMGSVTELFGAAALRNRAARRSEYFLSETTYGQFNPQGNKPDGLTFRIHHNDRDGITYLTIRNILESKLHQFDRAQAEGYLNQWRRFGIALPIDGRVVIFKPHQILFEVPNTILPLQEADQKLIERITILITAREGQPFDGEFISLKVPHYKLWNMAFDLVAKLSGLRDLPFQLRRDEKPTDRNGHAPSNAYAVPPAEAPAQREKRPPKPKPDLSRLSEKMRAWVLSGQTRWPKSGGVNEEEIELAAMIATRGGQSAVFVEDCNGGLRHYMVTVSNPRICPALGSLQGRLAKLDPNDENTKSVLGALLLAYFSPNQIGEVLAELAGKSPQWRLFFQSNPEAEIREIMARDRASCAEIIRELSQE